MADQHQKTPTNKSSAALTEDALPIQKTGKAVYIAGGVGLLVVLGLLFGSGGDDEEASRAKLESSEKAASKGLTKAELEERKAHLKRTQAAFIAAAADEAEEARRNQNGSKKRAPSAAPAHRAKTGGTTAKRGGSPKKKSAPRKKAPASNSLDFGADIASALE